MTTAFALTARINTTIGTAQVLAGFVMTTLLFDDRTVTAGTVSKTITGRDIQRFMQSQLTWDHWYWVPIDMPAAGTPAVGAGQVTALQQALAATGAELDGFKGLVRAMSPFPLRALWPVDRRSPPPRSRTWSSSSRAMPRT